jgi:long-chain acyl-CoA synthetase
VAIVVPNFNMIRRHLNSQSSDEELVRKKEVITFLQEQMNLVAKANKLQGFEFVKKIRLEKDSFQTKDLFTTTFKMKRHEAKNFYLKEIDEMYAEP